jgi:hypothetical protein
MHGRGNDLAAEHQLPLDHRDLLSDRKGAHSPADRLLDHKQAVTGAVL